MLPAGILRGLHACLVFAAGLGLGLQLEGPQGAHRGPGGCGDVGPILAWVGMWGTCGENKPGP